MSIHEEKIKLSITIPTWNRAFFLKELIQLLTSEILQFELTHQIEIVVINNGSDDETESICIEVQRKYNFFKYINNGSNIGARDNVLNCFKYNNGKYILLLGDDDRINSGSLIKLLKFLDDNPDTDLLLDISLPKYNNNTIVKINIPELTRKYLYLMGNAGIFVYKSKLAKMVLEKFEFDYFSRTWPQTQVMLIGLNYKYTSCSLYTAPLYLNAESKHDQLMIYNSLYLARTTFFDLLSALNEISENINKNIYNNGRKSISFSLPQIAYNVLQCGIFVDSKIDRFKTIEFVKNNSKELNIIEFLIFQIIIWWLKIPKWISASIFNSIIFIIQGYNGLRKKNEFVEKQINKLLSTQSNKAVRNFDFSNHN